MIKYKKEIIYGLSLAGLLFLIKLLEYRFVLINHALELYVTGIAIIFTVLGIWIALKLVNRKEKTIIVEKQIPMQMEPGEINHREIESLGLSTREMEVLRLMADGLSNQEIAEKLFLSSNTIKTHSSRLFEKLEVKRRTQAVEKARRLRIIGG